MNSHVSGHEIGMSCIGRVLFSKILNISFFSGKKLIAYGNRFLLPNYMNGVFKLLSLQVARLVCLPDFKGLIII